MAGVGVPHLHSIEPIFRFYIAARDGVAPIGGIIRTRKNPTGRVVGRSGISCKTRTCTLGFVRAHVDDLQLRGLPG